MTFAYVESFLSLDLLCLDLIVASCFEHSLPKLSSNADTPSLIRRRCMKSQPSLTLSMNSTPEDVSNHDLGVSSTLRKFLVPEALLVIFMSTVAYVEVLATRVVKAVGVMLWAVCNCPRTRRDFLMRFLVLCSSSCAPLVSCYRSLRLSGGVDPYIYPYTVSPSDVPQLSHPCSLPQLQLKQQSFQEAEGTRSW